MCAVPTSVRGSYHHGDLRAALLASATDLLEAGEPFSLRAVARSAGVSATAPYRHFADREALESALAVDGFTSLASALPADGPRTIEDLAELAVAYVGFALDRPALFRLMFGQECATDDDERAIAAVQLRDQFRSVLTDIFPGAQDIDALAVGAWGLVHGLAFLHLDGKLDGADREAMRTRVRSAVTAVLTGAPAVSRASNSTER